MSPAVVPAEHAHDLIAKLAETERELRKAAARIATLERSLTVAMLPYSGHQTAVVDGVLTVILNAGDTYQRVQKAITRDGEAGYEWCWQKCQAVPHSPASVLDKAMIDRDELAEMACIDDDEAFVLHYGGRR